VAVCTAHFVRADVALSSAVILFFVALGSVGTRARGDALAGASLGVACAIKFTGVFLAPCYLLRRVWAEGFSVRRLGLAVLVCMLAFAAASPYSLLRLPAQIEGVRLQWDHEHAASDREGASRVTMGAAYALVWARSLGWPGMLLSLAGLIVVRRRWRAWLPLLALPLVTLAFLSGAGVKHDRQMLASLVVFALLAGEAVAALGRRAPGLALGVAVVSLAFPLRASLEAIQPYARPGTRDIVLDWTNEHVAGGSRILTTTPLEIGFDGQRFEVVRVPKLADGAQPLVLEADYVITRPDEAPALLGRLPVRFEIAPSGATAGPVLVVREIPSAARPLTVAVPLAGARLRASENIARVEAARDGRLDTYWETRATQKPGQWLAVELLRPARLARVVLYLGERPMGQARRIQLSVRQGDEWRRVPFFAPRADAWKQPAASPRSQVLAFEPVWASGILLTLRKSAGRPWVVAEMELSALPVEAKEAPAPR
jgi:hypothetical protein